MKLQRVKLFKSWHSLVIFLLALSIIFSFNLYLEYKNYQKYIEFTDITVNAKVINQYLKSKNSKEYYVLKLRSDDGVEFYTTDSKYIRDLKLHHVNIKLFIDKLTFYEYLSGFYARSEIQKVYPIDKIKSNISTYITSQHEDDQLKSIFSALFLATPIKSEIRAKLATLGISHLLAISGFHLGVLSFLLFAIFRYPYTFFQDRYFPYRHSHRDIFIFVAILLYAYVAYLEFTPSLLRSFAMLIIGYFLYDRGVKIISMQTLFITVSILMVLYVKLTLSVGFWLSVSGVFYIFLYLIYYADSKKVATFFILPIFLYFMMLPLSIYLFKIFSFVQIVSIFHTIIFVLFYPLEIFLHLFGFGNLLDSTLISLLDSADSFKRVELNLYILLTHIALSLAAIFSKKFFYLLTFFSVGVYLFVGLISV